MKSFTVGFDLTSASGIELTFDERSAAEHLSYVFGTEHYEMVLKAGDLERVLPRLTWHLEEPRVGQSYPNFYAAGLASKFGKVVLSGTGGDELFGGYPWRYYRALAAENFEAYIDQYYVFWQRLIPNRLDARCLRSRLGRGQVRMDAGTSFAMYTGPRSRRSPATKTRSISPSTWRRRRSSTVCWWWRTS